MNEGNRQCVVHSGENSTCSEEEEEEEEEEPGDSSRSCSQVEHVAGDVGVGPTANSKNFNGVVVEDSTNVEFLTQTFYNGPLTIQHIFNSCPPGPSLPGSNHASNEQQTKDPAETSVEIDLDKQQPFSDPAPPIQSIERKQRPSKRIAIPMLGGVLSLASIAAVVWIILNHSRSNLTELLPTTSTEPMTTSTAKRVTSSTIISTTSPGDYLRMVSRKEWGAEEYNYTRTILERPEYLMICHTGTNFYCFDKKACVREVKSQQIYDHMVLDDIRFNFMVGGDGYVYEGRGWDYVGQHTEGYDDKSLGIALIGQFQTEDPSDHQMIALRKLIDFAVNNSKVSLEYKLTGQCRVDIMIDSPGKVVVNTIKHWPHWV